jgi:hypothetical protein
MSSFSIFHWILVFGLVWVVFVAVRGMAGMGTSGKPLFCTTCGHEGAAKMRTKGSIGIEILLWLCFLVPGLIYSLWRISSRHAVCASCGARTLVPTDSPMAKAQRRALDGPQ